MSHSRRGASGGSDIERVFKGEQELDIQKEVEKEDIPRRIKHTAGVCRQPQADW